MESCWHPCPFAGCPASRIHERAKLDREGPSRRLVDVDLPVEGAAEVRIAGLERGPGGDDLRDGHVVRGVGDPEANDELALTEERGPRAYARHDVRLRREVGPVV